MFGSNRNHPWLLIQKGYSRSVTGYNGYREAGGKYLTSQCPSIQGIMWIEIALKVLFRKVNKHVFNIGESGCQSAVEVICASR